MTEKELFQSVIDDLSSASDLRPERGCLAKAPPLSRVKRDDPELGAFLEQLYESKSLMKRLAGVLFSAIFSERKAAVLFSERLMGKLLAASMRRGRRTISRGEFREFREYLVANNFVSPLRMPKKKIAGVIDLTHPVLSALFDKRVEAKYRQRQKEACLEIHDSYVTHKEVSSRKFSHKSSGKTSGETSASSSEDFFENASRGVEVESECGFGQPPSTSSEPPDTGDTGPAVSSHDFSAEDVNDLPVIEKTERAAEELKLARPLYDNHTWLGLSEKDIKFLSDELPRLERHQPLKGKKIKWLADLWNRFAPTIEAANRPQVYGNPLEDREEADTCVPPSVQADPSEGRGDGEDDDPGRPPEVNVSLAPKLTVPKAPVQRPSAGPISQETQAKVAALLGRKPAQ